MLSHGLPDDRTWLLWKEALQTIIGGSGPPNWRTGTHLPSNLPQVSQSSPLVQIDAAVFRRLPFQVAIRGIGFVRRGFWANAGFVAARAGHSRSHKPRACGLCVAGFFAGRGLQKCAVSRGAGYVPQTYSG